MTAMDFSFFKQDIDELIQEFAEEKLTTLADMKRIWLDRKFSYIFDARPSNNLALFMQTLYNHSISYMDINNSFSQRLGSLYCLYCLYETQPFKPCFKIYLSLGELQRLKALDVDEKRQGIKVVSAVIKRLLEKNSFLFGFANINEYSKKERIKDLVDVQKACIQKMNDKLLANTDTESYLHMDMGMELDLEMLNKISKEYEATKTHAIREASKVVDVQNIEHIAEDKPTTVGDEMQSIIKEWGYQREVFSQQAASTSCPDITPETGNLQGDQPMSLPSSEPQLHDDYELGPTSFMELLLGNESPRTDGKIQQYQGVPDARVQEEEDTESEFVKELESQLFDDFQSFCKFMGYPVL